MSATKHGYTVFTEKWAKNKLIFALLKSVFSQQPQNWVQVHLSGTINRKCRVLDSRLRGCGFEPHRCHCVVVLEQDTFILADSTGSTQEDPSLFN